ncbi:DUF4097 domain-containing protein [Pseudoalteromonas phenolica]|uniref:DUF4097 domain-containing protein n=1 Tax=Pseudoalteromonas phenolica TaxID=161398 RepID=UPI00110ACAF1|nr:DUF4097 domain-containing protein [Pseudoalteromonas phenolica]TMO54247.1 hypothetical protein CWC21_16200 [Pseudoalteromonas phenolica]
MARDDKEKVVLKGQAAIDLWLQGRETWNKWVEENPVADVIFIGVDFRTYETVSFNGYIFPEGLVDFSNANFGNGTTSFQRADFGKGQVSFTHASFDKGYVSFYCAKFGEGEVDFLGVSFGNGDVIFTGANFGNGNVHFQFARFGKGKVKFSGIELKSGYFNISEVKFGDGDLIFSHSSFASSGVSFARSEFGNGKVDFEKVLFGSGNVSFAGAIFKNNDLNFSGINVGGNFEFNDISGSSNIKSLTFKFATFDGPVNFDRNTFNCVPDVTSTKFSHHFSLYNLSVNPKKRSKWKLPHILIERAIFFLFLAWFGERKKGLCKVLARKYGIRFEWLIRREADNVNDVNSLIRLKELAEANKDHQLALNLHIEEIKCSRWLRTPWYKLIVEFLFQKCSDYGRSIFRPIIYLFIVCLAFASIYDSASSKKDAWSDALLFSFSQMFSLIPSSKDARTESSRELYGTVVDGKVIVDIPNYVFGLAGLQSIASIALVFLVGLALRNRFRI